MQQEVWQTKRWKDDFTCPYLWCKARCCSDHSSSFWPATGRGAWPPCEFPHTSRRCREPGWRGPEPEWSRSGRAGSESDGTYAPAWPHRRRGMQGGRPERDGATNGGTLHVGIKQTGKKVWLQSQMEPRGKDRCSEVVFKRWWAARFKWKSEIRVM